MGRVKSVPLRYDMIVEDKWFGWFDVIWYDTG